MHACSNKSVKNFRHCKLQYRILKHRREGTLISPLRDQVPRKSKLDPLNPTSSLPMTG